MQLCNNVTTNLPYELINETPIRKDFLEQLSRNHTLMFYPLARETFCRLVVEAKILNVNVMTTKNYGATLEDWFDTLNGDDLVDFLKERTKENLKKIGEFL